MLSVKSILIKTNLVFHSILKPGNKEVKQNENSMYFLLFMMMLRMSFSQTLRFTYSLGLKKACNNGLSNSTI